MRGSNSKSLFLSTILLLFFSTSTFLYSSSSPTGDLCRPDQRDTLLEFKSEFELRNLSDFIDDIVGDTNWIQVTSYPKTKSWGNNSDCCYWDGVTCDVNSGAVIRIDLSSSCLYGNFKPNSSLFRLQHLRNLNLAYNNFSFSPIPSGFKNLMGLETLNLSRSSFSGQIPVEILHLTKLVSLDLSSSVDMSVLSLSSLFTKNPFLHLLIQNLTNLRELDITRVNISSKLPQAITNLTSLRFLRLRECHLFGTLPRNVLLSPTIQSIDLSSNPNLEGPLPEFNGNNSLISLDLSRTFLSGYIPNSISNLKHLSVLSFQKCSFTGKIPSSIRNLSHLTFLDLSSNNFSGEIPSSLQNLKRMVTLNVEKNKLHGNFPTALLSLTKLSKLLISYNQFTGTLPPNITSLSNLESFIASDNDFTGTLPSSLFTIPFLDTIDLQNNQLNGTLEFGNISSPSSLQILDISNNNFRGLIPRSISRLVNLRRLGLSHFNTQGPVDFSIFSHLESLEGLFLSHLNATTTIDLNALLSCFKFLVELDLSGNHITAAKMRLLSDTSSHLFILKLSGCGLREFPEFIKIHRDIALLNLSNNRIKDQVPGWLWSLPQLQIVDLSNNSFSGFDGCTRDFLSSMIYLLDLSKNNFSGEIPMSICGLSSLQLLDFSSNNFNGTVPYCFSILIQNRLSDVALGGNNLSGKLPDIFLNCSYLRSLNVGHNKLVGELPRSLSDCSSLEVVNLEHNSFNDTFPFWLESLQNLKVLVLRSNKLHGTLQYHPKVASWFPQLQIIDISHNAFTGALQPEFFAYWCAMSMERDHIELKYIGGDGYYQDSIVFTNKGQELEYTGIQTIFMAIDLSGNKLTGTIPKSIGLLKNLKVLNLSSNGFNGNIPSSLSNMTELESLDLSHNKLSGKIPPALGNLNSLSTIRVSHNKLVGAIPKGTQIDTQKSSDFEDNAGLCGPPLDTKCGEEKSQEKTVTEEPDEEEEGVVSWSAAAIALAPGVIFGFTIGHIVITQRPHWFVKVSCVNQPRRRGSR